MDSIDSTDFDQLGRLIRSLQHRRDVRVMGGAAFGAATAPMTIDVWSDVMCPFCYMGDTVLAEAVSKFEHKDRVEVRYHAYQLMPELPSDSPVELDELLSKKRGFQKEQIDGMNAQITERGAALGLDYRFDRAVTINTRTAHRVAHFANEHGLGHEMNLRLFKAYFTDGLNIGDREVLADLAAELGLDRDAALQVVDSDEYEAEVAADIQAAQTMGINGVPFFVFDNKYAVSGAQPVEAFTQALNQAWNERR